MEPLGNNTNRDDRMLEEESIDLDHVGNEESEALLEHQQRDESTASLSGSSSPNESVSDGADNYNVSRNRRRRSWWRILMDGPEKPVEPHVTMIFPRAQEFPHKLWNNFSKQSLYIILGVSISIWAIIFYSIAINSVLASPKIGGKPAELIGCNAVPKVWRGKNDACGLNGIDCIHTNDDDDDGSGEVELRFKCAADCVKESWTYSGTPVGDYESLYRPYVIGGGNGTNYYRADSFVCGSAAHRGVIGDFSGGCGILKFKGRKTNFPSGKGKFGIESIGFDSEFPESYEFVDTSGMKTGGCHDLRWIVIIFNVVASYIYGYLVYNPHGFFWPMFVMGFWTVILASNPPLVLTGPDTEIVDAELISLGFRRLLPALLAGYVIYESAVKGQLNGLKANLSRSVFWLSGYWIGVLENFVFGHLPLDRLTVDDLNAQAGAWLAVLTIIGSIIVIAFGQAFIIWRMGKFSPYIKLYLGMIGGLLILSLFPHQTLRIHHYIMALCLLPGTGFKTTPSLFYQGILVGLFVSGVSRWDFDSIIQTYEQLRRGAPALVGEIPQFFSPEINDEEVILKWTDHGVFNGNGHSNETNINVWDRFSLLINDVERYRGPWANFSLTEWIKNDLGENVKPLKYYIRVAFASKHHTGDYTKSGIVDMVHGGNWTKPIDGAT